MKLSWAVFWRVFVFQLVIAIILALALKGTALFQNEALMFWKPSVLWAANALAFVLGQLLLANGLLHVLWGRRLGQGPLFWRYLSFGVAGLFLALATVNLAIAKAIPFEAWLKLKTFGPLVFLLLFVLTVPQRLVARSNQALNATGHKAGPRVS